MAVPRGLFETEMSIVVAQVGARMHYAVPRNFFKAGRLKRLYTDCYVSHDNWLYSALRVVLPAQWLGKIERYHANIPGKMVRCDNYKGLINKYALTKAKCPLTEARTHARAARALANLVIKNERSADELEIYGFDTASLELFEWAKPRGHRLILEQCVAPRRTQERVLAELGRRSGMPVTPDQIEAWRFLAARERQEWELAELILCPSEYVRTELLACGVAESKLALVPYGVAPPRTEAVDGAMQKRFKSGGRPLRVLFAGDVGVRKGILALAEAAERYDRAEIEFVAAGHVSLPPALAERVGARIKFLGKCNRQELADEYARADCFALPSHLEGSATVVYEALSWGLPVVTTFAAGTVVEDGKSGFVGRAGDIDFLTTSLRNLCENAPLRGAMALAAQRRAQEFTLDKYGDRLLAALGKVNSHN